MHPRSVFRPSEPRLRHPLPAPSRYAIIRLPGQRVSTLACLGQGCKGHNATTPDQPCRCAHRCWVSLIQFNELGRPTTAQRHITLSPSRGYVRVARCACACDRVYVNVVLCRCDLKKVFSEQTFNPQRHPQRQEPAPLCPDDCAALSMPWSTTAPEKGGF